MNSFISDAPDGWSEVWESTGETTEGGIRIYELAYRIAPLSDHPSWKREIDWDAELKRLACNS